MTLASAPSAQTTTIRNDWTKAEVEALFAMPFNDLLFNAQVVHRQHFNPNEVQVSTLLSIKTGACPEKERLLEIEKVIQRAKEAKQVGSTRFCMGAAWRNPRDRDMPYILKMVEEVKSLGL